jgi:hypothetical protein
MTAAWARPDRKRNWPRLVYSAMAEPVVIAHLISERGGRVCSAPDTPMTVEFTPEAWAAHARRDRSRSVIRCERCTELLGDGMGRPPSARFAVRRAS